MNHPARLLLVCCLAFVLTACDNQQSTTTQPAGGTSSTGGGASGGTKTIAVIPKGTTHEFWKSIHAGANKGAQETGAQIIWKGPVKEDESAAQIAVVEDMLNTGVSGIVLAPNDANALARIVDRASQRVPVVIIDSDVNTQNYKSFVATDNRKGGEMGGDHLAKLLGGKGRVVMLRYQEGSASTGNREQGYLDAMKKHPEIQLVSINQYAGATSDSAQKAAENLIA